MVSPLKVICGWLASLTEFRIEEKTGVVVFMDRFFGTTILRRAIVFASATVGDITSAEFPSHLPYQSKTSVSCRILEMLVLATT